MAGQPDLVSAVEGPYGPHTGDRVRLPYAAVVGGELFAVADTANNRILLWDGIPLEGWAADLTVRGHRTS